MDLEKTTLSKVRQRKTNIIRYHLYVDSKKKKKDTNEQKESHRLGKQTYGYHREKEGFPDGSGVKSLPAMQETRV